jgi:16S rRNA (guanine966-N2)-methyltransferase
MLRIVSGRAKGCRLISPPVRVEARPTSDRVKEALFNILPSPEGLAMIDLFAGTGNVGLEAMSRGAAWLCFVENNPAMVGVIKRNLDKCGVTGGFEILPIPVERAVARLIKQAATFDIIFADPPYDAGWVEKTVGYLKTGELFSRDAVVVVQHSYRESLPENMGVLELIDQRKYGDTFISILKSSIGHRHADESHAMR